MYFWSNGFISLLIQDLVFGIYCVIVIIDEGCVVEDCVDFIVFFLFQVFFVVMDVICVNGNDGLIEVMVMGGVVFYVYFWNMGNILLLIDNFFFGIYEVIVIDVNGCFVVISIIIDESNLFELIIEGVFIVFCIDMFILIVVVNGGVVFYIYEWSDNFGMVFGNEVMLENFNSELINVLVVDNNGCVIQ